MLPLNGFDGVTETILEECKHLFKIYQFFTSLCGALTAHVEPVREFLSDAPFSNLVSGTLHS